jgi:hypothetical protein
MQRHGGPFDLAQFAFAEPNRVIPEDLEHRDDEKIRFFANSI